MVAVPKRENKSLAKDEEAAVGKTGEPPSTSRQEEQSKEAETIETKVE